MRIHKKALAHELVRMAGDSETFRSLFVDAAAEVLVETAVDPSVFQRDPNFVPNKRERASMTMAKILAAMKTTHN